MTQQTRNRSDFTKLWAAASISLLGDGIRIAALPLLAGMGPEAYRSPDAFDAAFRRAMPMCAGVLAAGALLAFMTIRRPTPDCRHPECRTHGCVTAPPLERGTHPETGARPETGTHPER